jgi:hypothetical protein
MATNTGNPTNPQRIAVQCSCGKRLAALPEHAGKRLKCPACGQAVLVAAVSSPQTLPVARQVGGESEGISRQTLIIMWSFVGMFALGCVVFLVWHSHSSHVAKIDAANAKVQALIVEATEALNTGDIEAAKGKVEQALALPHADALADARRLDQQIDNATDAARIRAGLRYLPDDALHKLQKEGEMPKELVSGYAGLDRRTAHLAVAQVEQVLSAREERRQAELAARKKREEQERAREEAEQRRLGLKWNYEESDDKMGRGKIKTAVVRSLNKVELGFPYEGAQRGALQLRNHPRYGTDVVLIIERGQFLCGIDGCNLEVRFGDGKRLTFKASEAADHSTTVLFISDYERFLANTRKVENVYIEAQFYQEGNRVFEFDVSGLQWP